MSLLCDSVYRVLNRIIQNVFTPIDLITNVFQNTEISSFPIIEDSYILNELSIIEELIDAPLEKEELKIRLVVDGVSYYTDFATKNFDVAFTNSLDVHTISLEMLLYETEKVAGLNELGDNNGIIDCSTLVRAVIKPKPIEITDLSIDYASGSIAVEIDPTIDKDVIKSFTIKSERLGKPIILEDLADGVFNRDITQVYYEEIGFRFLRDNLTISSDVIIGTDGNSYVLTSKVIEVLDSPLYDISTIVDCEKTKDYIDEMNPDGTIIDYTTNQILFPYTSDTEALYFHPDFFGIALIERKVFNYYGVLSYYYNVKQDEVKAPILIGDTDKKLIDSKVLDIFEPRASSTIEYSFIEPYECPETIKLTEVYKTIDIEATIIDVTYKTEFLYSYHQYFSDKLRYPIAVTIKLNTPEDVQHFYMSLYGDTTTLEEYSDTVTIPVHYELDGDITENTFDGVVLTDVSKVASYGLYNSYLTRFNYHIVVDMEAYTTVVDKSPDEEVPENPEVDPEPETNPAGTTELELNNRLDLSGFNVLSDDGYLSAFNKLAITKSIFDRIKLAHTGEVLVGKGTGEVTNPPWRPDYAIDMTLFKTDSNMSLTDTDRKMSIIRDPELVDKCFFIRNILNRVVELTFESINLDDRRFHMKRVRKLIFAEDSFVELEIDRLSKALGQIVDMSKIFLILKYDGQEYITTLLERKFDEIEERCILDPKLLTLGASFTKITFVDVIDANELGSVVNREILGEENVDCVATSTNHLEALPITLKLFVEENGTLLIRLTSKLAIRQLFGLTITSSLHGPLLLPTDYTLINDHNVVRVDLRDKYFDEFSYSDLDSLIVNADSGIDTRNNCYYVNETSIKAPEDRFIPIGYYLDCSAILQSIMQVFPDGSRFNNGNVLVHYNSLEDIVPMNVLSLFNTYNKKVAVTRTLTASEITSTTNSVTDFTIGTGESLYEYKELLESVFCNTSSKYTLVASQGYEACDKIELTEGYRTIRIKSYVDLDSIEFAYNRYVYNPAMYIKYPITCTIKYNLPDGVTILGTAAIGNESTCIDMENRSIEDTEILLNRSKVVYSYSTSQTKSFSNELIIYGLYQGLLTKFIMYALVDPYSYTGLVSHLPYEDYTNDLDTTNEDSDGDTDDGDSDEEDNPYKDDYITMNTLISSFPTVIINHPFTYSIFLEDGSSIVSKAYTYLYKKTLSGLAQFYSIAYLKYALENSSSFSQYYGSFNKSPAFRIKADTQLQENGSVKHLGNIVFGKRVESTSKNKAKNIVFINNALQFPCSSTVDSSTYYVDTISGDNPIVTLPNGKVLSDTIPSYTISSIIPLLRTSDYMRSVRGSYLDSLITDISVYFRRICYYVDEA